ncbi:MAG: glycosyltransferase [Clostridia bacterium]
MRIGEFTDSFLPVVDGVGRVVYSYAETLSRRGHECYVITPMTDMGFRGRYPFEVIDFYGISVPDTPQYKAGMPLWDMHYHERIKTVSFDIVHVHSPFMTGYEGIRIAKKLKVPVVGTFHSKYYDDFLQVMKFQQLASAGVKLVSDFYEKCDEVWAVSEGSAESLMSYGYKGDIKVMRNGTEIRKPNKKYIDKVRTMYNLSAVPVVLFVGQMNWKKNILCILQAVKILKTKGRLVKLILAGQGPHADEIIQKIEELDLSDRVEMTGHITDIQILDGLYGAADIFAFPSIYDNGPMVVREAAAMGTPSIVVKGSSAAEGIRHKENGFLCDNDPMDLEAVLSDVLFDHPGMAKEVGRNAQKTIPISWDEIIPDVEERYCDLIIRKKQNKPRRRTKILI